MKSSIAKLQKFFRLEAERDYDNRAVMGGLASMLEPWEAEARLDGLPDNLIRAVVGRLRDYDRLSPESRAEALKGLWGRIRRQMGDGEIPERPSPNETPAKHKETAAPAREVVDEPEVEAREPARHTEETTPPPAKLVAPKPRPQPEGPPAALEAATTVLDGVGPKNAEKLARMGLHTLGDMLYHFPRRYDDYTQLLPINRLRFGEEVTAIGTVKGVATRPIRGGKAKLVEVIVNDGSGALRVNWFNQPWLAQTFKEGTQVVLSGKVDQYLGRLTMTNPEWELLEEENLHTNRIVPVYPLTAKITQRWLRRLMNKVVNYWALRVQDPLPETMRLSAGLMALSEALLQVHFPDSWDDLHAAQKRLAFDEILLLQLGVLRTKRAWGEQSGRAFQPPEAWLQSRLANLPYQLTSAQQRTLKDIQNDLSSGHPMNRLLQGDVGSGKTVVAALGIGTVIREGAQAAIMAPTSILAEQHYRTMIDLLNGESGTAAGEEIRLMVGATADSEREEIRQGLEHGKIKVVVGTHALIEEPVSFADLQFVVIDEQHRFGVKQRANLRAKGSNPHLLVMTATPIPRSLALTVYGDLDLSVIDELPPNRQPVETHVLYPRERERAYSLIRSQIQEGRQAFIIYPLVEESENNDVKAAVEEHARLQNEVFVNYRLGLLHGRLKPAEKEEVMARFRDGEVQALVSTSVVEVGVDVPNASVMLIEGANRFGLAQLHQFRGRVGRGEDKSYCLLIPETENAVENERLMAMSETNDGFILAERDLDQRGPGEFLGTRQSGFSELRMASLSDVRLIEKARHHAQDLMARDAELSAPEHQLLAAALDNFWRNGKGDLS